MNGKTLTLIAAIIGIFIIAIMVIILLAPKNPTQPGAKLSIPGNNQMIQTNNFIQSAPVHYASSTVLYFDSNYSIQFDAQSSTFEITFTNADKAQLQQIRPQAEQTLLSKLGINQADACKLKVTEQIQPSPALDLGYTVFPLSFCSQSDNFPK